MPRKVRDLVADLLANGFTEIVGGGKGSHRKFTHLRYSGAVTLSGQAGDDAKPYQEKQIRKALEAIHEDD
jgi:predicted RNA binding protein YcfA (HicA-like mRNA interferase family)